MLKNIKNFLNQLFFWFILLYLKFDYYKFISIFLNYLLLNNGSPAGNKSLL